MHSLKFLSSIIVAGTIASSAVAFVGPVPSDSAASAAEQSVQSRKAYSTAAEVALHYASGQILHSVHVAEVTNPNVGVYCVKPSVRLNMAKTFPQVTVDRALSVGAAFWANWMSTEYTPHPICPTGYIQISTDSLDGETVEGSNSVAFDLVIQ